MLPDYIDINRATWNKRSLVHFASEFYGQEAFLKGKSSLQEIELALLGDLKGKTVLHLQCHFGQDSLSMARMGAAVTGVDFSEVAIEKAVAVSQELQLPANFICCDIYKLPEHLKETYDVVFTSYGVIGWLPDLHQWAAIVAHYLKPGGRFIFVEFHPVVWMYDNDFEKIAYKYFNDGPIEETENGTYANPEAPIKTESVGWNHGLAEVINSLLKQQLTLMHFEEFDFSPYNCLKGMQEVEPGKLIIEKLGRKIPLVYSLVFQKPMD
jgi:SAM-dependent methyltransferase